MEKATFWPAVQGITGIYCSILGTVSYFFPRQDGQPIWQDGVRVNAPPVILLAIALLGFTTAVPAIVNLVKNVRGKSERELPPAQTPPLIPDPHAELARINQHRIG